MSNTETKGSGGDAEVKSSPLLSESMICLGIACQLLKLAEDELTDGQLKEEIGNFQKRLLDGPMYINEVSKILNG